MEQHIKKIIDNLDFNSGDNEISYLLADYDKNRFIDYEKVNNKSVYNCVAYPIVQYHERGGIYGKSFLYINSEPICIIDTYYSTQYFFINDETFDIFHQYLDYITHKDSYEIEYIKEDFDTSLKVAYLEQIMVRDYDNIYYQGDKITLITKCDTPHSTTFNVDIDHNGTKKNVQVSDLEIRQKVIDIIIKK